MILNRVRVDLRLFYISCRRQPTPSGIAALATPVQGWARDVVAGGFSF